MRAAVKLKVEPTPYDGFNLVELVNRLNRENREARRKELPLPHRGLYKPHAWQHVKHWLWVTSVARCIRRAGYEALDIKGLPPTEKQVANMEASRADHRRLTNEFKLVALADNDYLIDPDSGLIGKYDLLSMNYLTGERVMVDFKSMEQWFFQTSIKRQGLRVHLKKTFLYPPLPEDELQVLIYLYLFRKLFDAKIRFGLLIYVNRNRPGWKKTALVEYDEKLMEKFLDRLDLQRTLLEKGKLIEPYLPPESHLHLYCPYRLKCPQGQTATVKEVKKKAIPLWKIWHLKRRKQQVPPLEPEQKRLF